MNTPSFKEPFISQIPALRLLQQLGYAYSSSKEAEKLRGGKTNNVLLEDVLRKQLKEINAEKRISSTKTAYISDANIENGKRTNDYCLITAYYMNKDYGEKKIKKLMKRRLSEAL